MCIFIQRVTQDSMAFHALQTWIVIINTFLKCIASIGFFKTNKTKQKQKKNKTKVEEHYEHY